MNEWLARGHRIAALSVRQWLSLLAIPLLLLGLFAFAFRDPVAHLDKVPAAVVNNDEPVTVNGQLTPLGRELAAELVNSDEPNYDWILTNSEDAASGLASGHYRVVVTIPKEFSANATSIGAANPDQATKARVTIQSADNVPLADGMIGRILADAARRSLGTTITENYLDNVYGALGTMHDKLSEAADAAGQLASGADTLKNGTAQLKDGSAQLADGVNKLNDGAQQLAAGADSAASGAAQLNAGASQLQGGASQLSAGLNTLQAQTASLPSQAQQLADGSAQVAGGTQQLADVANPALSAAINALDQAPSAATAAAELNNLIRQCDGTPDFCARLQAGANQVSSDATQLDALKADVRAKVATAQSNVNLLNDGAHQVAAGNAALAQAAVPLTQGIADAASGAAQVSDGANQVSSGAAQLADGTAQLASGAHDLADGTAQAAPAAKQLADGAAQVDDGATQVADGNHQLADGLKSALEQVPTYTAAERDHLRQIVAAPLASDVIGPEGYTNSAMALFAVLALWSGALVSFTLLPAMSRLTLISDRPTWWLALEGSVPGAILGAAQALGMSIILALVTHASLAAFGLIFVACLVAGAGFMVLNRVLVAASASPGRVLSILVLALTLATAVTTAQPTVLQSLSNLLPTTAALHMFRNALGGAAGPTFSSLFPVLVWLILAYLATMLLTERARSAPVRAFGLLPVSQHPATTTAEVPV